MTCKSAIYTVNNSNVALTTTAGTFVTVPLGSIIRRFGRFTQLEGDGIACLGQGYYNIDCSLSLTPSDAGTITAQIFQDGIAIPGAMASATATAGDILSLPISALVRNCGCDCNTVITVKIDLSASIDNCALMVEKI